MTSTLLDRTLCERLRHEGRIGDQSQPAGLGLLSALGRPIDPCFLDIMACGCNWRRQPEVPLHGTSKGTLTQQHFHPSLVPEDAPRASAASKLNMAEFSAPKRISFEDGVDGQSRASDEDRGAVEVG